MLMADSSLRRGSISLQPAVRARGPNGVVPLGWGQRSLSRCVISPVLARGAPAVLISYISGSLSWAYGDRGSSRDGDVGVTSVGTCGANRRWDLTPLVDENFPGLESL